MQVAGSEWSFGETQPGQTTAASALWLCCLPSSATHMHMPDLLHRHTTDQLQWLVQWQHQPYHGGQCEGLRPHTKFEIHEIRPGGTTQTGVPTLASSQLHPGVLCWGACLFCWPETPHLHTTGLWGLVGVWAGHGPKANCATIRPLSVPCGDLTVLLLVPITM